MPVPTAIDTNWEIYLKNLLIVMIAGQISVADGNPYDLGSYESYSDQARDWVNSCYIYLTD